jgi:hypothetical protein
MWSEECHFDVIIGWRILIRNEKISAPRTNDTFRRLEEEKWCRRLNIEFGDSANLETADDKWMS